MIWLNGALRSAEAAISANDRGLLLGESLFETMLLKYNVPQFWSPHLARLNSSCAVLGLVSPYDEAALRDGLMALLQAHDEADAEDGRAVLRLTVTGGSSGRGLVPSVETAANIMMQVSHAPPRPDALKLVNSDIVRFAGQPGAAHKTGQYVDNVMARRQALAAHADEAVMVNQHGRIACAAAGNIFARFGETLVTPPVSEGALPGIVRGALLEQGVIDGLQLKQAAIEEPELKQAEAIYISNSVNGVVPAAYDAAGAAQKKQGLVLHDALPQFLSF